jgi:SulP family sulfate permease
MSLQHVNAAPPTLKPSLLSRLRPDWSRGIDAGTFKSDAVAGLTTAIMLVPQGMAYAMLAGLPPIVGLYASTIPLVLYALFGTSRQLAVGPVAMVSLLVAAGVGAVAGEGADTATIVGLAALLALMVGVIQTAMGVFRLGFLVNFLGHPVVSGFTSAAALIIGLSQLKHLLGVNIPRSKHVHTILLNAFERLGEVNAPTLLIGIASITFLLVAKRFAKKLPAALVVVVVTTLVVWGLGLVGSGVKIVGDVPAGLPGFSFPSLDSTALSALLPTAIAISLVGFMESISVAKAFARKHRYELDANKELIGLGTANLGAAVFGGYPVTGGFSRTAVNDQAGAKTPLASVITAALIGLTLLLLTPLFHFLPKAVLASIIMVAVFGLIDVHEVKHLWKVSRSDLALLVITFFATLTLGIEEGIALGVGASLLAFVVRTTRPHYAVLGRVPGTDIFRNVLHFDDHEPVPGALLLRFDAQLYFGNISFLRTTVRDEMQKRPDAKTVILDATAMNRLDASAEAALAELHEELSDKGITLIIAGAKYPVTEVMERSGLAARLGPQGLPLSVAAAVASLDRDPSPLRAVA